ncbi:MAG TPA: secretin N-terminal domain-containing protein [Verrucomicrobiae bacterium]|nr:secretin N-terminal domain-containing protein [Verrucomicrobiae bacterium]
MRTCGLLLAAVLFFGVASPATLDLDVDDATLGDAVALLAAESGRNVMTDGSAKAQRVTIHLHGVSFEDALRAIAESHGLVMRRIGAIVVLASDTQTRREERTIVVPLAHAQPDEVAKELAGTAGASAQIVADARTRSLLVTADAPALERVRALIATLDAAAPVSPPAAQAYPLRYLKPDDVVTKLKALLAEGVFLADGEQNAVLVTGPERVQSAARSIIATLDVPSPQVLFEVKVADLTPVNDQSNVGLVFGGLDITGAGSPWATTYAFTGGTIPVNVQLNALVSKGNAAILATPKLVTINNKEADLSIGETYPIVYSTSVFGGQNVQYVDVGVHLRLTPTIGSDGSVTAELHPEYSELIGYTSTGYPIVASRKIDSVLRVHDNETIVLGGLVRDTSSETIDKLPGLSSIPLIGKLFQDKQTAHERDEIVFLITPHVIYPGAPPPAK